MNLSRQREATHFEVNASSCIRCASCATIAGGPDGIFQLAANAARVVRQPRTDDELDRARAALFVCPTSAIVGRVGGEAPASTEISAPESPPRRPHPLDDSVYYAAFLEAEGARWRMADLPLDRLDPERATPGLRLLVREIALSELTTFSASRRFLSEFADDADLSQWIAVWLYEESRHPQAMIRWLAALGERVGDDDVVRARATTPFMKSRMGTLVMNVISEAVAAARYLALSRNRPEPALASIAEWVAGDEARHGATFYAYARRRLARSSEPESERLDALKVLYFWLFESAEVRHPVNLLAEKASTDAALGRAIENMEGDAALLETRICALVGHLISIPLDGRDAVMPALRAQAERVRAASRAASAGHGQGQT